MSVGRSFAKQLCASAVVVLVCGSTQSLAQNGEYYTMGQGTGVISVIQGGAVNRSWSEVGGTGVAAIAVSSDVYTTGFNNVGDTGGVYDYAGNFLGGTPAHPAGVGQFYDSTSDGTNNYIVDFGTAQVYSTDLDYANPVALFSAAGTTWLGITYDPSNNSIWLASWGTNAISNYDMAGNLLSTFSSPSNLNTALGMDYTDGTLWSFDRNTGDTFHQHDTAGNLLQSVAVAGVNGANSLGGDFGPIPAPGTLALAGLGLACAGRRRR